MIGWRPFIVGGHLVAAYAVDFKGTSQHVHIKGEPEALTRLADKVMEDHDAAYDPEGTLTIFMRRGDKYAGILRTAAQICGEAGETLLNNLAEAA